MDNPLQDRANWFEALTGFRETTPSQVRKHLTLEGETLTSKINGHTMRCGTLIMPSLQDLRRQVHRTDSPAKANTIKEVIGDVQALHCENKQAVFQVASQFNLLEMISPEVTPEQGITRYEHDFTQGPACAVAAGAGTIYRNYFVPMNGESGQTATHQIDCLADLGQQLGNPAKEFWVMKNGYALPTATGLQAISEHLQTLSAEQIDTLRQSLRIGIQQDTEVTLSATRHCVTQTYCSALPVAYSAIQSHLWEPFARLILEASYEATICTAILNLHRIGNNKLFLTLLGGGAFGNEEDWIFDAIARSLKRFPDAGLDIGIVSYRRSNPSVQKFTANLSPAS